MSRLLRILVIIGTRPEAIKMVPIVKRLQEHPNCEVLVCSTGQHREMIDQVFRLFTVAPAYELEVMQHNQTPAQVAARVLERLSPLLLDIKPNWLLVQGDTTTVMAAAIAGHYAGCRIGHVEAGLRSFDRANPFPEEMNRVVTDHISDWHFAPTQLAKRNLLREGISPEHVYVTGNTVIDALFHAASLPCPAEIEQLDDGRSIVLVTAHRRENHGLPLQNICEALFRLAARTDMHIIYPVHRNPNVWQPVHERLSGVPNITLLPPLDYLPLVHLIKRSSLVLTDSGGLQEEAPALGKPVLVLREVTERPEAVAMGAARVIGTSAERIVAETERLLNEPDLRVAVSPYGDGRAADRIAGLLVSSGHYPHGLGEWDESVC